jgi:hypothetical protein
MDGYTIRAATGADWVWLMQYSKQLDADSGFDQCSAVIARMVSSLDEEAALQLPAQEFRDLFAACSRAIVGDDCPD